MVALTSLVFMTACGSDADTTVDPSSPTAETNTAETNTAETGSTTSGGGTSRTPDAPSASAMTQTQTNANSSATSVEPGSQEFPTEPSSSGAPTTTDAGSESHETSTPLSFAADIWPLWIAERDPVFVYRGMGSYSGCADGTAPCHGSQTPGAQLTMSDAQTTYAQMLNAPSVSGLCAGSDRVVAGEPDDSCLIQFYIGRLGKEDLDWVDDAEIELMRAWISQGAYP